MSSFSGISLLDDQSFKRITVHVYVIRFPLISYYVILVLVTLVKVSNCFSRYSKWLNTSVHPGSTSSNYTSNSCSKKILFLELGTLTDEITPFLKPGIVQNTIISQNTGRHIKDISSTSASRPRTSNGTWPF